MSMSITDITDAIDLLDLIYFIEARNALFTEGNDAGHGAVINHEGMVCLYEAETTDDVDVYTDGAAIYLVGTDGAGSSSSEWTVTVPLSD